MNDHRLMQIILAPIVTEKATFVAEKNNQVALVVVATSAKRTYRLKTVKKSTWRRSTKWHS